MSPFPIYNNSIAFLGINLCCIEICFLLQNCVIIWIEWVIFFPFLHLKKHGLIIWLIFYFYVVLWLFWVKTIPLFWSSGIEVFQFWASFILLIVLVSFCETEVWAWGLTYWDYFVRAIVVVFDLIGFWWTSQQLLGYTLCLIQDSCSNFSDLRCKPH